MRPIHKKFSKLRVPGQYPISTGPKTTEKKKQMRRSGPLPIDSTWKGYYKNRYYTDTNTYRVLFKREDEIDLHALVSTNSFVQKNKQIQVTTSKN